MDRYNYVSAYGGRVRVSTPVVLKAISFEDRGPTYQYRYRFMFSMAERPFVAEVDHEMRAWLNQHVGLRREGDQFGAYVVWDYAVLFENANHALAFRMRWT